MYIPAVLTGKPDFGTPNCPAGVLRYYHRWRAHAACVFKIQQRREGAHCSLYFSLDLHHYRGFLCHPSEQQSIPGKVKADEVRAVATSLQFLKSYGAGATYRIFRMVAETFSVKSSEHSYQFSAPDLALMLCTCL